MTTSVKLMLNKSRILKDGTYPLVFQIIHNRRKRLIYIGCHLREQDFDKLGAKVIDNGNPLFAATKVAEVNRLLKKKRKIIEDRIMELESSGNTYSIDDLVQRDSPKQAVFYLIEFIDHCIERKLSFGKDGTAAAYKSTRSSLKKYIDCKDIRMTDINLRFVQRYEDFLHRGNISENTVKYYLRNFRSIYNLAVRDGLEQRHGYPFSCFHTKPSKTMKRALSRANMHAMVHLPLLENPELEFSRDLYLFSFYAQGMAFVDIAFLKKSNICNGVINYNRRKSKQLIHITVNAQMQGIMDRYSHSGEYVFPIIDGLNKQGVYRQYRLALGDINRNLKRVAEMLNIDVPLTTYTARHTWATLARNCGAPISVISVGLGHTSEETTRIYLKEFDMNLLDQVNNMVANLFLK